MSPTSPADSSAAEGDADADAPADAAQDVKDKFREALERKRSHQVERDADPEAKEPSRIHGAHGPAASRREFRRKSG